MNGWMDGWMHWEDNEWVNEWVNEWMSKGRLMVTSRDPTLDWIFENFDDDLEVTDMFLWDCSRRWELNREMNMKISRNGVRDLLLSYTVNYIYIYECLNRYTRFRVLDGMIINWKESETSNNFWIWDDSILNYFKIISLSTPLRFFSFDLTLNSNQRPTN